MSPVVDQCPIRMPVDTISAWRDGELNSVDSHHVYEHVAICPACQRHVSISRQDEQAIREYDAPQLQEYIWQRLQQQIGQPRSRRDVVPRPFILGGLGAALALIIAFAAVFLWHVPGGKISTSITPTASVAATNTVTPTLPLDPGWVAISSFAGGEDIKFAQSAPLTGYVCGDVNMGKTSSQHELLLWTTRDGGRTWSAPQPTPVPGVDCLVFINPHNPQEIILKAESCPAGCDIAFPDAYRSLDGGQTWIKLSFPGADSANFGMGDPVWAGNSLFVPVNIGGSVASSQPLNRQIAVSVNDVPLAWLDLTQAHVDTGWSPNTGGVSIGPDWAIALGSTLFACCYVSSGDTSPRIIKTQDHGATWTAISAQGITSGDIRFDSFIPGTDGKTLYVVTDSSDIARSVDGGSTWQSLPEFVGDKGETEIGNSLSPAPDGTIYIEAGIVSQNAYATTSIYKLTPATTRWVYVTDPWMNVPDPQDRQSLSLSWDAKGHPQALWRSVIHLSTGTVSPDITSSEISRHIP